MPVTLCPSTGKTTHMTYPRAVTGSPTVSPYTEANVLQGHKKNYFLQGDFLYVLLSVPLQILVCLSSLINGGAHGQNSYFLSAKFNSTQLICRKQRASLNAEVYLHHSPLQQRCAWQLLGCFCFGCITAGGPDIMYCSKGVKANSRGICTVEVQHAVYLCGPIQTYLSCLVCEEMFLY